MFQFAPSCGIDLAVPGNFEDLKRRCFHDTVMIQQAQSRPNPSPAVQPPGTLAHLAPASFPDALLPLDPSAAPLAQNDNLADDLLPDSEQENLTIRIRLLRVLQQGLPLTDAQPVWIYQEFKRATVQDPPSSLDNAVAPT